MAALLRTLRRAPISTAPAGPKRSAKRRRLAELEAGLGDLVPADRFDGLLSALRIAPADCDEDLGVVLLWLFELRALRFTMQQLPALIAATQTAAEPAEPIERPTPAPTPLDLVSTLTIAPAGPPAPGLLSRAACVAAASSQRALAA